MFSITDCSTMSYCICVVKNQNFPFLFGPIVSSKRCESKCILPKQFICGGIFRKCFSTMFSNLADNQVERLPTLLKWMMLDNVCKAETKHPSKLLWIFHRTCKSQPLVSLCFKEMTLSDVSFIQIRAQYSHWRLRFNRRHDWHRDNCEHCRIIKPDSFTKLSL